MPTTRTAPSLTSSLLAATLLLAGCGSDSSDGARATDPAGDDRSVTLEQLDAQAYAATPDDVDGHALLQGTTVTVSFDGSTINAYAGCNHLFGRAEISSDLLSVKGLGGTEMGCQDDLMAQDEWLTELLASNPSVALDGGTLTLTSGDTSLHLSAVEGGGSGGGTGDPDQPTSNAG